MGTVRGRFFTPRLRFKTYDELNAWLLDQCVACAEALVGGACSADVVLNILDRRRQPAAPASIETPASLRLSFEPVADCTRYDRLRGAGDGAS